MRTKTMLALQILAPMIAVQFAVAGQQPDPKVDEVLKAARDAMGGEAALSKIQSVTVTGSARRVMGEREMTSDVTIDMLLRAHQLSREILALPFELLSPLSKDLLLHLEFSCVLL